MTCADLHPFVADLLSKRRANAFRAHLPSCLLCQGELLELMQIEARLSDLPRPEMPRASWWRRLRRWLSW